MTRRAGSPTASAPSSSAFSRSLSPLPSPLLLESANDAAATLAEGISGSREAFVSEMNDLAEELTFRGLGYYLLSQFGAWAAIVITALTFALAHGLLVGIPVFFVIGAGLALLRYSTDSLYPPILVHMAFNGLQMVIGVLG